MESFGTILRNTREEKKLSVETVSRDTTISRNYIEALEDENLSVLPGNTYALGFLRNYSTYLGLDSAYLVKLFNAKILQETAAPESLLHPKKNYTKIFLIAGAVFICVCAGIFALIYYFAVLPAEQQNRNLLAFTTTEHNTYALSAVPIQRRVYVGDILSVRIGDETISVEVTDTLDALALKTPIGLQFVELGEDLELNIDGVNGSDMVIFLTDISSTNADLGADVRMFLTAEAASSQGTDMAIVSQIPEGVTQRVVLEDNRAYPFTLTANFRDTCLYRYRSDSNTPIENLFVSGNELVMQAQNGIRVWISNENAVTTKIIADGRTYDLGTGSPGKVAVKDIRWIRESDGIYKLVVIDID